MNPAQSQFTSSLLPLLVLVLCSSFSVSRAYYYYYYYCFAFRHVSRALTISPRNLAPTPEKLANRHCSYGGGGGSSRRGRRFLVVGGEGSVVVREERRQANVHGGAPPGRDHHSVVEEAHEGRQQGQQWIRFRTGAPRSQCEPCARVQNRSGEPLFRFRIVVSSNNVFLKFSFRFMCFCF